MKIQICTKTVLDSTIPGVSFDANGISNHYHDFHNVVAKNWRPNEIGEAYLEQKIEKIKKEGKGKDFDCILGLSGGVDSSYMLHTVVQKYGLRPLVFHVDAGWNTEVAVNNIHNLVDKLNIDLFTEVVNWPEVRDFQVALFKSGVPHLDIPQDHAFGAVLYNFCEKHKIKTILNGGNISTECVLMPYNIYYWGADMRQIKDILNNFCDNEMATYPFSSFFRHKIFLKYFSGVDVFKPLNYMPYAKKEAVELLESEYGWKPYPQKHFESRFTKFYEGYWLPSRFNFDVRKCQLSSLILTGQLDRGSALEILKKTPYTQDEIRNEIDYICSKLEISTDDLKKYHDMPLRYYWDYKNNHYVLSFIEKIVTMLKIGRRGGAF
jgi:N-acetyl sugar amidotransferase